MTPLSLALLVAGVATFGIGCYCLIGSLLSEVEAERTDLARDAHYTGKTLKNFTR